MHVVENGKKQSQWIKKNNWLLRENEIYRQSHCLNDFYDTLCLLNKYLFTIRYSSFMFRLLLMWMKIHMANLNKLYQNSN